MHLVEKTGFAVFFAALFMNLAAADPAATITTIAGTDWVFPRDGRAATDLPLGHVEGVAIDRKGNLFITDSSNHLVLKVDSHDGTTVVVAGNGKSVFSGDGGLAVSAGLSKPNDVAVDREGNLYLSESGRIRKVTADGVIKTIAGGGTLSRAQAEGGPATKARLVLVDGIAIDAAGTLYFAEYWTSRVSRVSPDGTLTTVAGNGSRGFSGDGGSATQAELSGPTGVALDSSGNVYIADNHNGRIRMVDMHGIITTFAGGGRDTADDIPATQAALSQPQRLAVDGSGNLYIGGYFTTVRKVSPGGVISTVAGSAQPNAKLGFGGDGGPALKASVAWPRGIAIDTSGNVFFADSGNNRIRRVSTDGIISTAAGNGRYRFIADATNASSASLTNPAGVTLDSVGNLYIADTGRGQVLKVTTDGLIAHAAGTAAFGGDSSRAVTARMVNPEHVALDASGSLYVADSRLCTVFQATPEGSVKKAAGGMCGFRGDGGFAVAAGLEPSGVAVDSSGNIYIADTASHRVRKVTNGRIATIAGDGKRRFLGDSGPGIKASLADPSDVTLDAAGNLFIADKENCRIRKLASDGTISTVAGDGRCRFFGDGGPAAAASLNSPEGVAVDAAGNLYIADSLNNRIRKVTTEGIISTVAGNGRIGFSGDGGDPMQASLKRPRGVAVDRTGNLYIADSGNDRIRLVRPESAVISTRSGQFPEGGTLMKKAREAEAKFRTVQYTAEMTIEVGEEQPNRSVSSFACVNPGKVRVESKSRDTSILMISDSKSFWMYNAAGKRYAKIPASASTTGWLTAMGINIPSNLQLKAKTVREETIEIDGQKHDCWVVESRMDDITSLLPQKVAKLGAGISDVLTTQWFDKELAIDLQSVVSSKIQMAGKPPMQSYSRTVKKNLKINEPIADSLFAFTPPPETQEVALADLFTQGTPRQKPDLTGKEAPGFELKGLDSKLYSLAALKGRPVLLDFWGTWCEPCVKSMPILDRISREYRDAGLVVLGVNVGDDRELVEAFLKETPLPYPVMMSGESGIVEAYQVQVYPTFVLIGRDGKIAAYEQAFTAEDRFRRMLTKAGLTGSGADSAEAGNTGDRFTGTWVNVDTHTRGLTKLSIRAAKAGLEVRGFGACHPTDCDWGLVPLDVFGADMQDRNPGWGLAKWDSGFSLRYLIVHFEGPRMMAESYTVFKDKSGRRNFRMTDALTKSP